MDEDEFVARLLLLGFRQVERIPYGLQPRLKSAWSLDEVVLKPVLVQHFLEDEVNVITYNAMVGRAEATTFRKCDGWDAVWEHILKLHQDLTGGSNG